MRGKIPIKGRAGKKQKIKIRYLSLALMFCGLATAPNTDAAVSNDWCADVEIVFARGSGGTYQQDKNYLEFVSTIESKLKNSGVSYRSTDLDYPAIGIGIDNLSVTLGAWFGSGDAYEFGESVDAGVKELIRFVNRPDCPNSKYVIGGYSQGAMVVSKALGSLNANQVIYAATFGDPKIYLPEGKGIIPAACSGKNLSDYRMYVPDCQAYKGLLGSYIPYEPMALTGKVGTWCNKRDIFCSSHLSIGDHLDYVADDLYEDASRVIVDKIAKALNIESTYSSPHDTAIVIDASGKMNDLVEKYKAKALILARKTLGAGGRVALYDFRTENGEVIPVEHCNFENCTLAVFERELAGIQTTGDNSRSLLSSSLHTMKSLTWKYGSTKSLVMITDGDLLGANRDGASLDEVVKLSKKIDPVNIYLATDATSAKKYTELATATDGGIATSEAGFETIGEQILARFDSLPRVEENEAPTKTPTIEVTEMRQITKTALKVEFKTTGEKVLVALNGKILGITAETAITLTDLDFSTKNQLTLVPLGEDVRGEEVSLSLAGDENFNEESIEKVSGEVGDTTALIVSPLPKAPATGKR